MQIHELNTLASIPGSSSYLAVDNGSDTGKISIESLKDCVTPEMFGAVGDGATDDTTAIQNCVNAAKYIILKTGANYKITSTISIVNPITIDFNHATITSTHRHAFYNFTTDEVVTGYSGHGNITFMNGTISGGGCSFAHGENITFRDMKFYDCINNHIIELCATKNVNIIQCVFRGMWNTYTAGEYINLDPCYADNFPWFDDNGSYDGTPNTLITVDGCHFSLGDTANTAYGDFAFGCHSNGTSGLANHSYITFTNNIVYDMKTYCLRLNCFDYTKVTGNTFIYNSSYAIEFGAWVVMNDLFITNNHFINNNSTAQGYVYLVRPLGVDGLSIYDNIVDKISSASSKQVRNFYFNINSSTTWRLIKMDPELIPSPANAPMPLTSYNRMIINHGSVGSGTYMTNTIHAYYTRNFVANEQFPFLIDSSGTASFGTVKITSASALTFSSSPAAVYIYKDDIAQDI